MDINDLKQRNKKDGGTPGQSMPKTNANGADDDNYEDDDFIW